MAFGGDYYDVYDSPRFNRETKLTAIETEELITLENRCNKYKDELLSVLSWIQNFKNSDLRLSEDQWVQIDNLKQSINKAISTNNKVSATI